MNRQIPSTVLILALLYAVAAPAAPCPSAQTAETPAPGLKHLVLDKGEVAATTSYRILLGVFDSQSEADGMLDRLQKNGFSAVPDADGTVYRIVISGISQRAEAEDMRTRLIDRGFSLPLEIQEIQSGLTDPEGPWRINVLEVDPKRIEVRVAHAYDAAIGLETTAALALRRGALAAINGGYFRMTGLLAGDSQGALLIEGRLLSEPDRGRAAVGFYDRDGMARTVFGRLGFRGEVHLAKGKAIPLDGLNRHREPSEIVLYTPEFHRTTLTSSEGAEVVIENGRITEIRQGAGSSVIPSNGMVLSIGSEQAQDVLPRTYCPGYGAEKKCPWRQTSSRCCRTPRANGGRPSTSSVEALSCCGRAGDSKSRRRSPSPGSFSSPAIPEPLSESGPTERFSS